MRFDVITLFPEALQSVQVSKIWQKAQAAGKIDLHVHDLRSFSTNKHQTVDDTPYGGGAGMVLSVEPLVAALESIDRLAQSQVIAMTPQGQTFDQTMAESMHTQWDQLILVCGRYEGFDQRFLDHWVDQMVSIGDFVLSGGELAAMVVMETVSRLIPGVIGRAENVTEDTFSSGGLKHAQYTKPSTFRGMEVPKVLLSGDHEKIKDWRHKESRKRTLQMRPDLIKEANILSSDKTQKDT